ncbi:TPA: hypothetical protein DCZ36_00035 [Candidatus Gracilibacteria bacterium]|nr:hypothetical protein [Candidatus Gracilibacteria bacterium]
MGTEHLEGGVEGMGPQMKGIINNIRKGSQLSENFGYITDEGGKNHFFNPFSLISFNPNIKSTEQIPALMEEFSNLSEKSKVIFNPTDKRGTFAMNLALDTSGEAETLIPKTESSIAGILDSADSKEVIADSPECSLEDEAFRIDSTGWNEVAVEDSKGNSLTIKTNLNGVCELPNGVQLFTPNAMARELILAGRVQDIMTGDQAQWLLKNSPNNIPEGCEFAGFINSKDGKLHFNGETACYWIGESDKKGNPKALFCIDINKVDEEMRPYTDEMIISDYDMESMMQVRLLKNQYLQGYIK